MFKLSGSIITLVVLGGISSYIWYKIYSLNTELEQVTYNYNRCIDMISKLNLELAIKDGNIKDLNESLHIANSKLEELILDKKIIEEEFETYREKTLSDKLSNKKLVELIESNATLKQTCEYGIELNKVIKELKYEDL